MTDRTLLLLRHAKADRGAGLLDIDRPLTHRGHADAAAAGAWLAHRRHRPDLVICSPAKRTRQTWHGVAVAMAEAAGATATEQQRAPTVHYEAAVYADGQKELLELIRAADEAVATILLIGHNPGISLLSAMLDPDAGDGSDGLRTSGLAVHRVAGDWAGCGPGSASLVDSHTARG